MAYMAADLEGYYDVSYQSLPQLDGWFEGGRAEGRIANGIFEGKDVHGAKWTVDFEAESLTFRAVVDPTNATPNTGLVDDTGQITRVPQKYDGVFTIIDLDNHFIIKAKVSKGPIVIDVQLVRRA